MARAVAGAGRGVGALEGFGEGERGRAVRTGSWRGRGGGLERWRG